MDFATGGERTAIETRASRPITVDTERPAFSRTPESVHFHGLASTNSGIYNRLVFSFAKDDAAGVLVGIFSGTEVADQEYQRCIDAVEASDHAAVVRGQGHVVVLVTDHDTPRPPPSWRQRMAASNNSLRADTCYFAVVSPSLMIRGVFTAISWLMHNRAGRTFVAWSTFAEAAEGARKQTGKPLPQLEALYAEAQPGASGRFAVNGPGRASGSSSAS